MGRSKRTETQANQNQIKIMAANAKRENSEHPDQLEHSKLDIMRAKIRKLEATVKANSEELLMFKHKELQMFKNDQVDHHETQENDVVDFLSVFMNNHGFKRIADKILSFLDCKSFFRCRFVCRSWRDFLDNEWSMLQLQIFHLTWCKNTCKTCIDGTPPCCQWPPLKDCWLKFGPLFKIMEKTTNKSELRIFINMCRELVSEHLILKLEYEPLEYMIDNHRHQELNMLLHCHSGIKEGTGDGYYCFTRVFKYACQFGCEICVKTILDRSEEKGIDLNSVKEWETSYFEPHEYKYEHCLHVAHENMRHKEVLDLLLRSAEEKGININATRNAIIPNKPFEFGKTLREAIIRNVGIIFGEEDYTEETYKILKIDPSVDFDEN